MSENLAKYNVLLELETKQRGKGITDIKKEASGLPTLFKAAGAAFAGIISAVAVKQVVGRLFEVTKKYQKYNTILKVALGSQKASNDAMSLIEKTAASTIFSVDELTASYIKFANRGVKPTGEEIIALADLAASQGKSFDQLTEAVLDAQTGEFERLKEFGIKARKEGDKISLSFKGINKEIKNTPDEINKAILAFGRMKGVAGANLEQMSTLTGMISNIGDTTEKIFKNLGARLTGVFTGALQAVKSVVEVFAEWTDISLAEKLENERIELNVLVQSITDVNVSQERRNKLINELQTEYPDFLDNLDSEKVKNEELEKRLEKVNKLYLLRIVLQVQQDTLDEAQLDAGTKRVKQFKEEKKARTDLNKVIAEFNLDVELKDYKSFKEQLDAVNAALKKRANIQKKWKGGFTIGDKKAYNAWIALSKVVDNANEARENYAASEGVLEKERVSMEGLMAEMKQDMPEIFALYEALINKKAEADDKDPKKVKVTKKKGKKEKSPEQIEYENRVKFVELSAAFAEKMARKEIGDAKKLANELAQIEIDKQITILSIKQEAFKKGSLEYIEIENQIDSLSRKLRELSRNNDVKPLDILPEAKLSNGLIDITKRIMKTVKTITKMTGEEIKKAIGDILLETVELSKQVAQQEMLNQIDVTNNLIEQQEERVSKAEENAEKGKVKQLKIEEARLKELTDKREKYVQAQRAIANLEILQSNAVAAANSIEAISKGFGKGGIPLGIATGIALAAQLAIIISTVKNSFADIPAYAEGIEAFGMSPDGRVKGKGTGKSDDVLTRVSKGERITPDEINKKIGYSFPNAKLPEAVALYKLMPSIYKNIIAQTSNKNEMADLKTEIITMRESIESLKIVTKLDVDGFVQTIERRFDNVRRRKQIMG